RVVAAAGGDECLVAGGAGRKTSPKWSADGRAILFDRALGGHTDLMRAEVPLACVGVEAGPPSGGDSVAVVVPFEPTARASLATTLLVAPEPGTQNWETTLALLRDGVGAGADELAVTWMRARQLGARTATQAMLARSDGRSRSTLELVPSPTANAGIEFDPVVRTGAGGRAIVAAIGQEPQLGAQRTLWVAATRENAEPLVLGALENTGFDKQDVIEAPLGNATAVVVADRTGIRSSFDGGATFSQPVQPDGGFSIPSMVAMPNGTIGIAYFGGGGISFVTLRDSATVSARVRVTRLGAIPLTEGRPGTFRVFYIPVLARDAASGRLVVAIQDTVAANALGVLLFESRDNGATWQSRGAPPLAAGESTFAPAIAFGPDGRLHLAYGLARSADDGATVDVVHAVTDLDGTTWTRTTVTPRPIVPANSVWAPYGEGGIDFFGDYFGLAVSSTAAYVSHPAVADDGTLQMAISRVADAPRARDLAGSWFEPATSGQGFDMSFIAPGRLLVFFYGHHDDGRNLFLVGVRDGDFGTNETLTVELFETRNGRFNGLDPNAIQRVPWGRLELRFADCGHATARLVGLDGTSDMALVPLGQPVGSACVVP
ncbi:MAG TPA: sialidase family protein, partial [Xanthomonadales bacterium]|nr:sialidase family protein [Xanthomonadales bacterium]